MASPTLSFENHDRSIGLTCPGCGHSHDFGTFTSNDLKIVARQQPAPYVIGDRMKATVYECRKCFGVFWFHEGVK